MKREFDWDRFKDKKNYICVHCKTKEEADDLYKQAKKHEVLWVTGKNWHMWKENTVYFNKGSYGSIAYVNQKDCELLEWGDYMEKKHFTKSDLKDGMIVEIRSHELYFVFNGYLIERLGYIDLNDYNDDLSFGGTHKKFDIQRVYKPKLIFSLRSLIETLEDFNKTNLELIYEKKTISVAEAEKLLEELTNEEYEIRCD